MTGEQPETSWLGVALVTSSVIGMPFLGIAKRLLADKLGSVATTGREHGTPRERRGEGSCASCWRSARGWSRSATSRRTPVERMIVGWSLWLVLSGLVLLVG